MRPKKILISFSILISLIVGLFLLLVIKSGAIYFFYIPPSDFRSETVVKDIFVNDMYDSFIFTDNKESIFFSYFGSNQKPIDKTVKFNLKNHYQEEVAYQLINWGADWGKPEWIKENSEAKSYNGIYLFRSMTFQNHLNLDSGWGYQTIEIIKNENNKVLGHYNSKNALRNIRWGKNYDLYFVEVNPSGGVGSIKKIVF